MEISKSTSLPTKTRAEQRAELLYGFIKNYNSLDTQDAYKRDIKEFLTFLLKGFKLSEFGVEIAHAVAYKNHLIEKKLSHSTINRKIACASAYLDHLIIEGFRNHNPFLRVKRFKENPIGTTPGIDLELLKGAVANIETSTGTGKLRVAIFRVFLDTGMRVEALCKLKLSSIATDEHGVYVHYIDKGGKHQKKYLSDSTINSIYDYLEFRSLKYNLQMNMFLFKSFGNNSSERLNRKSVNFIFDEIFSEISHLKISPHSTRVVFITEVIKREGLASAQERADHSSIASTVKYNRNKKNIRPLGLLD